MQSLVVLLLVLFSIGTYAREVFVFIQSDDAVTQYEQSVWDFKNFVDTTYDQKGDRRRPKIVISTLNSIKTSGDVQDVLRTQINDGDVIRSIIISAHGSDTLMGFNDQTEAINGSEAGKLFHEIIKPFPLHSNLSVYLWSCHNGCNLEHKSSFLDEFTSDFSTRVSVSHPGVDRLDVIGHMFFGHRDSDVLFKKLSAFSVISLKPDTIRSAIKTFKKIGKNKKFNELISKNKMLKTILLGEQFTPAFTAPILAFGFSSFFTSLILFSSQQIAAGGSVLFAGLGVSAIGKFVLREFPKALHQYVRVISTKGFIKKEEMGYLSDMYQNIMLSDVNTCRQFYK